MQQDPRMNLLTRENDPETDIRSHVFLSCHGVFYMRIQLGVRDMGKRVCEGGFY